MSDAVATTGLPQTGDAATKGDFAHDFLASIVVFLVALPLCLGIAIASGAPPATGLITGIVGGLVVGVIAGSPLQVSGPAAGLAVIVYELINKHGLELLGVIVLIAGVLQLIAGVARLGQWFRAVAPAVIQGMLAGIGVLIFASQFHVMVDDAPPGGGLKNLLTIPAAIWKGVTPSDDTYHHHAATIGLLTIIAIVVWRFLSPKKLKWMPPTLFAVVLATGANFLLGWEIHRIALPSNLLDAMTVPTMATFQSVFSEGEMIKTILIAAITVAAVASAETLLCANAVDQLHTGPRTKYDRELSAQGIGNMICGAIGGLPMTGVIVRSSANVEAGARTRWSAVMHGGWLLLFVAMLPGVLAMIPKACLAAVLVRTGYKLMNFKAIKRLREFGWGEVVIYAVTVVVIVAADLLTGVLVGIALSVIKLVYTFSHLKVRLVSDNGTNKVTLWLDGAATFLRLPRLADALEQVPPNCELHVHFEKLSYIDHACMELLIDWERQHEALGGRLVIDWESLRARFRSPTASRESPQVSNEQELITTAG